MVVGALNHHLLVQGAQDGTDSTDQASSSNREADIADSTATLNEFELIGREDERKDITNLVLQRDLQGPHVISVWGMGGIGKTTLIREVYQSPKLTGLFDKHAWATIMRPFNCSHLIKSLAEQLGDRSETDLTKLLQGKRYLIILDDVWFADEWDAIMARFLQTPGSCIIVTTRQESIAKHCSKKESDNIHKLKILESNHARELFTKKVLSLFPLFDLRLYYYTISFV